ncbi:hypothetical protein RCL_jg22097.t1 [Rhizophagus clarus]|uniref:Uncharacterized protein n=1 Tax=Rhizophagus clarus TaxID=94130 RepID=A0A8H3LII6_9GLOM|nr:hypothetical protein RCL_jg22097.t1 [Rhizophagus clarus]
MTKIGMCYLTVSHILRDWWEHAGKNRLIAFFENYDDLKNKKTSKSTSRVSEKAAQGKKGSSKRSRHNAKGQKGSAGSTKERDRLPPVSEQMKADAKRMLEVVYKLLNAM